MNNVTLSGYAYGKAKYKLNPENNNECNFYIRCYSTYSKDSTLIPCKCEGWLADQAYAKLSENAYVEAYGELIRENSQKIYVKLLTLSVKKPKCRTQFYIRSTEFIEAYSPKSVIERLENDKEK